MEAKGERERWHLEGGTWRMESGGLSLEGGA